MKNKTAKKVTLESISNSIKLMAESINDLALATAKGFDEVNKRMDNFDLKIDHVEKTLSGKISGIDIRIDDLAFNRATKDEVYLLTKRMVKVEAKVGIKI
jgi:hypothetical protein